MTDQELRDNVIKYRKLFPLLSDDFAYLDNAATTQKPVSVLDAMKGYYENDNANPFRGVYDLSERATERYEEARAKTAAFINAESPEEIVFVRNATEALNLLAYSWCEDNLSEGDEIVVRLAEDGEVSKGGKYRLTLEDAFFQTDRTVYAPGEEVTVCYDLIATDTDYHFYSNDVDIKTGYESGRGYVITFVMPERDVTLSVSSRNSMEYEPEEEIAGTTLAIVRSQNKTQNSSKEVVFEKVKQSVPMKLENFYDQPILNPTWDDVDFRIRKMLDTADEHVLLCLGTASYGVRYIQSASIPGGYTLQLGLEQGDQTRLVEKDVTPEEIREIFRKFYDLGIVEGIEKYKPVKFK